MKNRSNCHGDTFMELLTLSQCNATTEFSETTGLGLRDPASWLPLAAGASLRNVVPILLLRSVHEKQSWIYYKMPKSDLSART